MAIASTCPPKWQLSEYANGKLGPDDSSSIEQHLSRCRPCLDRCVSLGRQLLAPDIPDCHVVKEIGRGRFGVVYKAWSLGEKPRIVALKVLSCPGEMERSRFDREIAVLKKIDSPWVVKCLEAGTSGEARYFVMDYVEGVHLDEHLASSAKTLPEKLAVFQRVCRAVGDAHDKGVVHRDLKPRNILIDEDGNPHILDFGICVLSTDDWSSWARDTLTHAGDVIGTLKYMSPEQAWGGGAGPVDKRSDIWALGVMLYEIITDGDYPYKINATRDRPAAEALLERIRKELPKLPKLDQLPRGRDLETLLSRCLAWEPDRRIDSAGTLADDLDRYIAGKKVKCKPLRVPDRIKRLAVGAAVRSRWMLSVAFVAALGLTLWLLLFLTDIGWEVAGHQYQGQERPVASAAVPSGPRDSILVVGVSDKTVDAAPALAAERNIPDVTRSVISWRALHGHFMQRLVAAQPKAVVWDYYFLSAQPGDPVLTEGILALEDAGVPVVLAAATYGSNGRPDLSPGLTHALGNRLRHGAIVARDMVARPGEVIMAVKRADGVVLPGLALTTLAALLHPDAAVDVDWPGRDKAVHLLYEISADAYLRERDRIPTTRVFRSDRRHASIQVGDLVASMMVRLHPPKTWKEQTVPYEKLLTCGEKELQNLVKGRVLIVGDFREPRIGFRGDRHRVRYGAGIVESVPGCYLLSDAVAGLLDRRYVKRAFPLPPVTLALMLMLAVAGCLLPLKLAAVPALQSYQRRHTLWVVLPALAVVCLAMMRLSRDWTAVHLGLAGFSLLVPMTGSFWVEFARNRFQVLSSGEPPIANFDLATPGTITLASKQATSRPAAK